MARRYWLCKKCGTRHERTVRKCDCGGGARPKPRVPTHAKTLRDDSYEVYKKAAAEVHGIRDESCNICRRPRSQERKLDRDHDHKTGKPRGLLCVRCNRALVSWMTPEWLLAAAAYLQRSSK